MKKRIAALIALTAFFITYAEASILGSVLIYGDKINIGNGLDLYSNTFMSDQKGVGHQTEYYGEYTPNSKVIPTVVTGEKIYGKRNASEIMEYMDKNSLVPMLGINASFFSFSTGIPMGHVITDGVVTSKDDRTLPGVGFRSDGTAFIDDLLIETVIRFGDDYVLQVPHINKFISDETQMLTLYTSDFGDETGTDTQTLNVILENITDSVRIGKELRCTVKEVVTSDTPVALNDDEMVLCVNTSGNQWAITLMNAMYSGEELTIKTTASSDKWNVAYNGLASEGARLLTNGTVNPKLEAGAAPRTAVGIKNDGTVLFYVLDGRQSGYSYGAKQKTVAERLKELGCSDALNLDGGGSTTMSGVYPGCDENVIINSPSEKSLRKVTNFIFLRNTQKPTGNGAAYAYIYPYSGRILTGSSVSIDVKAVDENYYPVGVSSVQYSSNETAAIGSDGVLTALSDGKINIEVNADGAVGRAQYQAYKTPDDIKLYNADNSSELTVIDALPGDTFRLYLKAFKDGMEMISSNDAFSWCVSNDGANISRDGLLEISEYAQGNIVLTVKAGIYTKSFQIRVPQEEYRAELYPTIYMDISNSLLTVVASSENSEIDTEKSFIKIDGKKIFLQQCELNKTDEKNIIAVYPLTSKSHKIYCEIYAKNSYVSVCSVKSGEYFTDNIFADTNKHWAKDIVSYMNAMGIVNGSTEGGKLLFRPDGKVTRAEFAIMAANFMNYDTDAYKDVSLDAFADASDIPSWASAQIKAVYKNGLINGKDNNGKVYFEPDSQITRAEAITILSRILPENMGGDKLQYEDLNNIPSWAADAFKKLNTAGLISGYDDNTIKPQNSVTRAEAVTMFYNIF